jgi:hypothetical protein
MEGYCLTDQSPQRAVVPVEEEEEEEEVEHRAVPSAVTTYIQLVFKSEKQVNNLQMFTFLRVGFHLKKHV